MAADVQKRENVGTIEVFSTKNRGRGVRVLSAVKAGCLLMVDKPFEYILKNMERGYYCDSCLTKREEILHKCSACRFAYYCNRNCQRAAWPSHKLECEGVNRVSPKIPSDHIRLMARLCRRRKKLPAAQELSGESTFPSHIDQLQSSQTDFQGESQMEFSSWLYTLRTFMGEDFSSMLPAEILQLFGRMRCNTCEISEGDLHSIGIGLYLRFSMFNHSCDYNCIAIHNGTILSVRATRDIPENKECFVSYVDVLKPAVSRNCILRNVFQFSCKCQLCRDVSREQLRHSVRCGNLRCKEAVLLNADGTVKKCSLCSFEGFLPDFPNKLRLIEQQCITKLAKAEDLVNVGNWKSVLELSEECLALQKGMLHPFHHQVVETLNYAMDACINLKRWEQALEYGLRSVEHLSFHYPGNNASAAIQLMRVAKLQLHLQLIPQGLKHAHQAEGILVITHGADHPLLASLKEMTAGLAPITQPTIKAAAASV